MINARSFHVNALRQGHRRQSHREFLQRRYGSIPRIQEMVPFRDPANYKKTNHHDTTGRDIVSTIS